MQLLGVDIEMFGFDNDKETRKLIESVKNVVLIVNNSTKTSIINTVKSFKSLSEQLALAEKEVEE